MEKVSIIVPIYNVEKYLVRCLDSLSSQTLKDIEIVLVDDGSPDNCPAICDRYAASDFRIKVIHKMNGGLSSARNAGLDAATGKYVGFVDSDDTVSVKMFENMFHIIEKEQVDFVMADMLRIISDNKTFLVSVNIDPGLYNKEKIKKEIYPSLIMGENIDYGPLLSVCCCLYRTDFLRDNKIRFDEKVTWSEDNIFSAIVGYCASSFYYLKGIGLYNYYQNSDSITTSYRPGAWKAYCTMNDHIKEYFDKATDFDFTRQYKLHSIYYACVCINMSAKYHKKLKDSEIKAILNSVQLKQSFHEFIFPKVHWKLKFQLFLMKYRLKTLLWFICRIR